tara:strand:+ start:54 stop:914 length:861 start_codon:yes stop_codon:yes gene_type:complete
MKRILVTGATGFVGSSLVRKLVEKKYDVVAQGRTIKPWTPKCVIDRLMNIDFEREKYELGNFDSVVNCISTIEAENNIWEEFSYSNCSIAQGIARKISCKQLIHLSTCSVYSKKSHHTNQPYPINLYGLSKYVSEKLVEIERQEKTSLVLRFPIIIGKNKQNSDFIKYIIDQSKQQKTIELFGKGMYYRNLIHVSEVVRAIISSIESDSQTGFQAINLGSVNSSTVYDICKYLSKRLKENPKISLLDKVSSNNFDSFVDVSKSSIINYNCLSVNENLDLFINEINL